MSLVGRSTYLQNVRLFGRNARLFLASQCLAGVASGIFSLLFNLYLVRMGFHEDFIGRLAGATTLATGLVAFPAGLLADRIGRRNSLIIAGVIIPLLYLAEATVVQPEAIMVFGIAAGASVALISVCFNPFMAENSTPQERTYLFSASFTIGMMTGMLGSLIGGVLPRLFSALFSLPLDDPTVYRYALWLACILFLIAGIPFFLLTEHKQRDLKVEIPRADLSMAPKDTYRRILVFGAGSAFVGIAGGLIVPFFNVYFTREFAMAPAMVGLIFAMGQALIGLSGLVSPLLARRSGQVKTIAAGHFAVVPFLFILAGTSSPWVAAGAYWGRNIGVNMVNPVYGAFSMEMVPARLRATLSGINTMAWNTTWAISSAIGGVIILTLGYPAVFLLSALFYIITGMVYLVSFWTYRNMK